jgi:hypothetical protein
VQKPAWSVSCSAAPGVHADARPTGRVTANVHRLSDGSPTLPAGRATARRHGLRIPLKDHLEHPAPQTETRTGDAGCCCRPTSRKARGLP